MLHSSEVTTQNKKEKMFLFSNISSLKFSADPSFASHSPDCNNSKKKSTKVLLAKIYISSGQMTPTVNSATPSVAVLGDKHNI